jgi:glutamate carboxypeptidase
MIERELEALVAVSSPSGDREGAEECVALATAFLPGGAEVERVPCSTPDHADDMVGRLRGTGARRLLLLGHLDTVVHHGSHRPLARDGDRLTGSGAVDMKGGVALSLALMRQLAERPELYAEVAVLLVNDEEWRTAPFIHAARFAGFDACLCFEGGERTAESHEAVIVKRKAAATLRVDAHGRSSHSGSAPELGRSALLALTAIAQLVAGHDDPAGPDRLTAVPTILRSGDAFNVVPAEGELLCDLRADRLEAFDPVFAALPSEHEEVRLESTLVRAWPGLDSREATADVLADASGRLGRPIVGSERGGASDASHIAAGGIACTIDGLGPLGGGAHTPDEWVSAESLQARAEVALALTEALLRV